MQLMNGCRYWDNARPRAEAVLRTGRVSNERFEGLSRMNAPLRRRRILLCATTLAAAALGITPLAAQTLINGAGATFPAPLYTKWFSDYRSVDPSVQINYQAIGSGGGIRQITEGTVDFGAS